MANTIQSAYMDLQVPVVLVDPGPTWASDLNACLNRIDSHNHSLGQGVQVNPNGININSDMSFNGFNIISPRSVRFLSNGAPLGLVTDLNCGYVTLGDLYFNDGSGNQIRITQGGSVAGSSGTITGLPSGTASAAFVAASGTFVFQQATNTAANIDGGSFVIRYPGSYPTPSGNYILLQAPSTLSSGYSITLPALPGQTNVMTLSAAGVISSITYDAVGQAMTSVGANAILTTASSQAVSSSCGIFGTSNTSFTLVTNLSVSITTHGRPVLLSLIDDGNLTNPASIGLGNLNPGSVYFAWFENSSQISNISMTSNASINLLPASVNSIWIPSGGAGTYTYSFRVQSVNLGAGAPSISVYYCKIFVREL